MGVEQVDTAKSTLLFLGTCQRRKEMPRQTHRNTEPKRKLIGGKEAARNKGVFQRTREDNPM